MKVFFVFLCFFSSVGLQAQHKKVEKEYPVAEERVPENAIVCLNYFSGVQSGKWLIEENETGQHFEFKGRINSHFTSVEFTGEGDFLDVEVEVRLSEIPDSIGIAIKKLLDARYDKIRIRKIQIQYSGKCSEVALKIRRKGLPVDPETKFEVVARVKKKGVPTAEYEFLFSAEGALERYAVIVPRNTDILDY